MHAVVGQLQGIAEWDADLVGGKSVGTACRRKERGERQTIEMLNV